MPSNYAIFVIRPVRVTDTAKMPLLLEEGRQYTGEVRENGMVAVIHEGREVQCTLERWQGFHPHLSITEAERP